MKDILTGKAKEDFEDWLRETYITYWRTAYGYNPENCNNALIIEWLDTVDLIVSITSSGKGHFGYSLHSYVKGFETREEGRYSAVVNTRHEATERAIKAVVEVYNSR